MKSENLVYQMQQKEIREMNEKMRSERERLKDDIILIRANMEKEREDMRSATKHEGEVHKR